MKYSICRSGVELGEFEFGEIVEMLRDGRIDSRDWYWKDGMFKWQRIEEMFPPEHLPLPVPKKSKATEAHKDRGFPKIWCIFIVLRIIASAFAFWTIGNHPYNFYVATRWIIFIVCAFAIWMERFNPKPNLIFGYLVVLVIFNPFMPFHLPKPTWHIWDCIAGVFFLVSLIQRPTIE